MNQNQGKSGQTPKRARQAQTSNSDASRGTSDGQRPDIREHMEVISSCGCASATSTASKEAASS
jgi:hypothetical protein